MNAQIQDWSPEQYHAAPHLSRGGIVDACKSLRIFEGRRVSKTLTADVGGDAAALGDLAHMATLQQDRFMSDVVVRPPMDRRRTKGLDSKGGFDKDGVYTLGKEASAVWEEKTAGKRCVSETDRVLALGMSAAIFSHPVAGKLVTGPTEVPVTWTDPETGMHCKVLMDARPRPRLVADVKTTFDPSPDGFRRMVQRDHLHIQDPFYTLAESALSGCSWHDIPPMVFIVVRSSPPHEVAMYTLDSAARMAGIRIVEDAMRVIADRSKSGDWSNAWERPPGGQPIELSLPEWSLANPMECYR